MATHACERIRIPPLWDTEFKNLEYITESFNDPASLEFWAGAGYSGKFVGDMADMRGKQPVWNPYILGYFHERGWKDIGTSYYRMNTGTILPTHGDLYKKYIDVFKLQGQEHTIRRAVIFLEDWQSGHYLECDTEAIVHWHAGDGVVWKYDTPHMAANLGLTPRYTVQVTGHI